MLPSQLSGLVVAIRASETPHDMPTKIVAVDGHGGSGNTTLAATLAGALEDWLRWFEEEDAYVRRERPAERADAVLPGDASLWH